MKRTVQLFILLITLSTSLSFSQMNTKEKIINLKGDDTTEIVKIKVDKNQKSLDLNIKCEIEKGFASIEVLDANKVNKETLFIISKLNKSIGIFKLIDKFKQKQLNSSTKTDFDFNYIIKDTLNVKGYFSLDKTKFANGEINKKFNLPTEGEWTVKVKSEKGKGEVYIKSETN